MKIIEGLVLLKLILLSTSGQKSLPYINNLNDLDITEGGFCGRENNHGHWTFTQESL